MNPTVVFDLVNDRYTVRFPYDALLVELLKSRVPSYARTWVQRRQVVDGGQRLRGPPRRRIHRTGMHRGRR